MAIITKSSELKEHKDKLIIVHYSSSSIEDKYPSISSISTYDTSIKLLKPFSREDNTKEDEISLLEEFIKFVSRKTSNGFYLVGWNWGDEYGFKPILKRYTQLTGKKPKVTLSKVYYFDLLKIIAKEYKEFFGGLKVLAEFNSLNLNKFIDGFDEIELLQSGEFEKLHNSTSTKVDIIYNLMLRYLNKDIQVPTFEEIFYKYTDIGAYPIFQDNLNKIEKLINVKNFNIDDVELQSFLRNLLYGNVITCLETYLSDTFIQTTVNENRFLEAYISNSNKFSEKSKKSELYAEIFDEIKNSNNLTLDRFLVKKCIDDIKEVTFHNINIASKLYKEVLGIEFPQEIKPKIYKAVNIRHDLIHRNGKDKNDKIISIEYETLINLIKDVNNFVDTIQKETEKIIINK